MDLPTLLIALFLVLEWSRLNDISALLFPAGLNYQDEDRSTSCSPPCLCRRPGHRPFRSSLRRNRWVCDLLYHWPGIGRCRESPCCHLLTLDCLYRTVLESVAKLKLSPPPPHIELEDVGRQLVIPQAIFLFRCITSVSSSGISSGSRTGISFSNYLWGFSVEYKQSIWIYCCSELAMSSHGDSTEIVWNFNHIVKKFQMRCRKSCRVQKGNFDIILQQVAIHVFMFPKISPCLHKRITPCVHIDETL